MLSRCLANFMQKTDVFYAKSLSQLIQIVHLEGRKYVYMREERLPLALNNIVLYTNKNDIHRKNNNNKY